MATTHTRASPVLLEREAALELLAETQNAAETGVGSLVLVEGEAGVGKTALLRRFVENRSEATRTVWGSCDPLFTPRPLGPVHDIAQELGGPLLDAIESGSERIAIFSALLTELSSTPTVAIIEDVHWADEATLDAIAYLGRRLETTPSIVVLTHRNDELGPRHPLRLVVGELPSRSTVRIALEPLSPDGVAELARVAGRSASGLHETTGGNPFFVTEVLAAGGDKLPATVRDAVLARAGRLSGSGRALLEAVSVVPGGTELWLLERLAPDEMPCLPECLASGVLRATSAGVEFRHELARIAIEESLGPDRRVELNRGAIRALADPPAGDVDLAALAHHAEAAGDRDDVLRFAPAAADRAARLGAHREAAAQYARAARFANALPLEAQAELYGRVSYESYLTGDFADAIEATMQALDRYRALGNALKEGDCLHALARLLWSTGRTPEARSVGCEAVALLESQPAGHELAMAYAQLASLSMITDDFEGVASWSMRASDLAARLGADEILAASRVTRCAAEYAAGSPGGREKLESELADALSHGHEEVAARAFNHLVRIAMRQREYSVVDRYLDAGFDYCRDRELGNFRQGIGAERARRYLDAGEWDAATDAAGLVLSTARTAGMAPFLAQTVLGQVRARRGDPDVWAPLDRALELAEPSGELQRLGVVAAARAEAAWLAGDRLRALDEARATFELAVEKHHAWFAGELAYWQWRSGALDDAPGWIAEPYALELQGKWREAAGLWHSLGCPYERARALADGDESAKLVAYRELLALGATPSARHVARALRELGVSVATGPRASTQESPAGLTRRESEILGLLAQGMRNSEIADHLVLSRRTVDHHVSAILRKLGARTRLDAVAKATRLGLIEVA